MLNLTLLQWLGGLLVLMCALGAPASWAGIFDASQFGPACPQRVDPALGFELPGGAPTEDCLTISVASPTGVTPDSRLPVVIWVHGGGFTVGSGAMEGQAASVWTSQGLAHESLNGDEGTHFALLDMIAALQWVRDNIRVFGGDPDRVTIAGVSAGGMAVQMLMASPEAEGLFRGS